MKERKINLSFDDLMKLLAEEVQKLFPNADIVKVAEAFNLRVQEEIAKRISDEELAKVQSRA